MPDSLRIVLLLIFGLSSVVPARAADDMETIFRQNCAACHTIGGGRLVGPDLKEVTRRQERAWLVEFIVDAPAVIAKGDPYAAKIVEEARGVIMPKAVGIDRSVAAALLDHIEARAGETSAGAAPLVLTPEDAVTGRNIFLGHHRPVNQGPACITCHQVAGLDAPGGGLLGPDLTQVLPRLGGAQSLVAWLGAPATPTMKAVYRDRPLDPTEVKAMTAFFEEQSRGNVVGAGAATVANSITFLLAAIIGAVTALGLLDWNWRRRLTSVRDTLTRGGKASEKRRLA